MKISINEFDRLAENGDDLLEYFDLSTAVRLGDKRSALAQRVHRAAQSVSVQKAKTNKTETQHAFVG